MTFGSLFAGIGGMDLGLERAGMVCKWQVEIDPFCQKVLAKHWPEVPKYGDIREVTGEQLGYVDLIAGGFPCQDLSDAGSKRGLAGSRSGLYAHLLRLASEIRPKYIVVENVSAILKRGMGVFLGDLAEIGFDAEWDCLPACRFGAPHERDRVFIIAYPSSQRPAENCECVPLLTKPKIESGFWEGDAPASRLLRVADGLADGMDRVKSCGNAVVPQIAEWIGRRIVESIAQAYYPKERKSP